MLKRKLTRSLRRVATLLAATAMVGVGFAGSANAFSYTTGDLVGIVVENSTEMIVNLGPASSFTSSSPLTLPSQYGGTLSTARFLALAVPDNTDPNGIVTFTADSSINVPTFDNPPGTFSQSISNAYATLDQPSNDKWMNNLNGVPATGTGIFSNTANLLVVDGSTFTNGYTQSLNLSGDGKINVSFPFSTELLFNGGTTASGNLWTAQIDPNNIFGGDLFTLNGTISAHDNGNNTVSFALVPEPGTLLLLGSGLVGLAAVGRRRKTA